MAAKKVEKEILENTVTEEVEVSEEVVEATPVPRTDSNDKVIKRVGFKDKEVLTLGDGVIHDGRDDREAYWGDIIRSKTSKDTLTGVLSSVEDIKLSKENRIAVGVVDFHGFRVVIPITEMNIIISNGDNSPQIQNRILSSMMGCEIDFIITEIDNESHTAVASRKEAMERKIKDYYIRRRNGADTPLITEGSVVEARVIAVGNNAVRLEIFGAECFVRPNRLDSEWICDAKEKYYVGQILLVRMSKVAFNDGVISVDAEARSLYPDDTYDCISGNRYLGRLTGKKQNTYYIRLKAGANAIAYEYTGEKPYPAIGDEVAFTCTRMDKNSRLAIGILTRVIRRNR